jgi:hypothetical protein
MCRWKPKNVAVNRPFGAPTTASLRPVLTNNDPAGRFGSCPEIDTKVSFENTECCLGRYGNKSKNNCNQKHYHSKLLKIKRNAPHPTPPATVVSIGATKDIGLTLGESEAGGALLLLLRLLDCDAYPQWRCTRFKLDLDRVRANEFSGW